MFLKWWLKVKVADKFASSVVRLIDTMAESGEGGESLGVSFSEKR